MKIISKSLGYAMSLVFFFHGQAYSASDLYISEYVEGSSYNKALELYNDTGAAIDLSSYEVQFYFNGSASPGRTISLTGSVANGDVYVLAHSSADASILSQSDLTTGGSWYNGNDAVTLLNGGVIIDAIGQLGIDPGSEWGSGLTSTQNNTLRRKVSVTQGDPNAYDNFDPSTEWDGFAQDTFDGLGAHISNGGGGGTPPPNPSPLGLVINEVDADTTGADSAEFIELYDGGVGNSDLSGYVIVLYNGNGDKSYAAYDLDGYASNSSGYFVIGNSSVVGASLVIPNNNLQNGADAVALYQANGSDFPNGTLVSTTNLVDAVVYDTNDADDPGLLTLLNSGQPQLNEDANGNKDTQSNQRCPNGGGGARNTSGFVQSPATPGQANACGVALPNCGSPATLISAVQGNSLSSPILGQTVTIEGVVVGDFQDTVSGLSGFFVEEETGDQDADASTSEGVFVYDNGFGIDVVAGDLVRVTGAVTEAFNLTELSNITSLEICASGLSVLATAVNLPFADLNQPERYEGMLIQLPQNLTVTENYNLGRYGEVMLSSSGRLFTPTQIVSPGASAIAQQTANDLNKIFLDDGNASQNPDPIIFPGPSGLSALNTLRSGDSVSNTTGVLTYSASAYRIEATQAPQFVSSNPRIAAPVLPGTGSLRVASFNVLNYFNGDGQGGGFPTARGATSLEEFNRQRDKIIAAISAMNADIIGLMEIENDGYSATSAIQDLVNGLNAAAPAGISYSFVNPGVSKIGTDAISVGFIYRNNSVQLVGSAAILDSSVDAQFIDTKNRPSLAQTFMETATGARLTVVVNHLKSKGSSCASIGDPDTGDGQGNCNQTRTSAAQALVNWLAGDPTNSNDSDFLIIGDLNSYAMEDPISAIVAGAYTNLVSQFGGSGAYSYVFMGQSGNLDHALSSASLVAQVTGLSDWHINADEPHVLDYNVEYKSAGQISSLYNNDAYRASDHDPIVLELNLQP